MALCPSRLASPDSILLLSIGALLLVSLCVLFLAVWSSTRSVTVPQRTTDEAAKDKDAVEKNAEPRVAARAPVEGQVAMKPSGASDRNRNVPQAVVAFEAAAPVRDDKSEWPGATRPDWHPER